MSSAELVLKDQLKRSSVIVAENEGIRHLGVLWLLYRTQAGVFVIPAVFTDKIWAVNVANHLVSHFLPFHFCCY